jgi:hypothetical protein
VLLASEGVHDSCLVECGQGAFGRVGLEQQALVLFGTAGTFDNDRDRFVSLLTPGPKALESIDHLVPTVVRGYDAYRHGSCLIGTTVDGSRS